MAKRRSGKPKPDDEGQVFTTADPVNRLGNWVYGVGYTALLIVPAIWTYQFYHWVRWDTWKAITVADGLSCLGLDRPHAKWKSIQGWIDWVVETAISGTLAGLILGSIILYTMWADAQHAAALRRKRARTDLLQGGPPVRVGMD